VAGALEGEDAGVEGGGDGVGVAGGDGQGDDVAEAGVGDRKHGGVGVQVREDAGQDAVEAGEVDGLAADLHEIAAAAFDMENAALERREVLGEEPAVDFGIEEALLGRVAGEEGFAAEGEAAVGLDAGFDVVEEDELGGT
jgi:hypothetical protein